MHNNFMQLLNYIWMDGLRGNCGIRIRIIGEKTGFWNATAEKKYFTALKIFLNASDGFRNSKMGVDRKKYWIWKIFMC